MIHRAKALNFTQVHEDIALQFLKAVLPSEDPEYYRGMTKALNDSDWFASEADRLSGLGKGMYVTPFGKNSVFNHPLGHAAYTFSDVPTLDRAVDILPTTLQGIDPDALANEAKRVRQLFFCVWRRWLNETMLVYDGAGRSMSFFPADTRIPDHTIWHHMSVASVSPQ